MFISEKALKYADKIMDFVSQLLPPKGN